MTQCERLEAELRKRPLTPMQIINDLKIPKYTGRISDLRGKGIIVECDESNGYGIYRIVDNPYQQAENPPGKGDSYEGD